MAKNQRKIVYVCSDCGAVYAKWQGQCRECSAWNTLIEEVEEPTPVNAAKGVLKNLSQGTRDKATLLREVEDDAEVIRFTSGISELDRALGGGVVKGSTILLSGEPGIGKSTLLLQLCNGLRNRKVLYVSGEESKSQIKMRAGRLGIRSDSLYLLCETDIEAIIEEFREVAPDVLIIDSIQTVYDSSLSGSPGSVAQVKQSSLAIMQEAKEMGSAAFLVGHVNKEGQIAGPKVLEHMVDVVLYFEGDRDKTFRVIRAKKNRFGSTNEIGVFEMCESGLTEVPDPSEMLLLDRPRGISGNCSACIMEGTRPIIAEIQALVTKTVYPAPKRLSTGIDYNRVALLLAVLEKRLGLHYSYQDVYVNVIGGLKLYEPACDLSLVMSLISGYRDIPIEDNLIAIGEIGLAGECRAVSGIEQRINEAVRLGFTKILIPARSKDRLSISLPDNVNLIPIRGIYDLLVHFPKKKETDGDNGREEL